MAKWQINEIRKTAGNNACIIFIHGFTGDTIKTWRKFGELLRQESALIDWDLLSFGYESSLIPDLTDLWQGNPPIKTIADSLRTFIRNDDVSSYGVFLFIAHSMGGLVLQRALLDDQALKIKVDKVILFGTPSFGLSKAWIFQHPFLWRFFRQIGDMGKTSTFITSLRNDWNNQFGDTMPFGFLAVAGRNDEFVPISASIEGFPDEQCAVVPGNHLTIIKPTKPNDASIKLVINFILGKKSFRGSKGTVALALERRKFEQVVALLGKNRKHLDRHALVDLALAYDGLGKRDDAMNVLGDARRHGADAMGVLAGRHKRNWLQDRIDEEARTSLTLYDEAYEIAKAKGDFSQAYYHGINLAFLALMYEDDPGKAQGIAQQVLEHCTDAIKNEKANDRLWRLATEGEANLILGKIDVARARYESMLKSTPTPEPWQLTSTAQQALLIADKLGDEQVAQSLLKLFSGDQP
ncbi:alpha/beta hydrolase [Chlorobaculum sp. 24CR]|uniref:alpha/beta fold hydrolase n=1 Tax=Chlorobaculum sp. 24CR TaxID=2508878 RepID=UPI00100B1096|nr:alpha/beta hydrolase [Chlorobaculum sp. 24CR]RXK89234.1 alpha/beta hydrolase [Chlorobaculum sp. 24CR]